MGRYYCGQISGKFWLGIQSSDDASYFGVDYSNITNYHVCGCTYEEGVTNVAFCDDCYSTSDEHKQAMIEEEVEENKTWCISDFEISYDFEQKHLDIVTERVNILEIEFGKYMTNYNIIDENDEITYDYLIPADVYNDDLASVVRLCLGRQILYCLQNYGGCSFHAET